MKAPPTRLVAALADSYRLDRELGRGGMATVYLSEDLKHKRQVAVKVLHPELAASLGPERFMREIEIAAKLTHPHILMLIDSGEADGYLYYVMPFVNGESLRDRLDREKHIDIAAAVRLLDQVASALTYAHGEGVVHRDIKPENILLAGDQAVVADFGIARAVEVAGGEKLTGTGVAIGTPAYMSPEQAFGQDNVDGRTDVYAMGCVMFEMVAGRAPFESTSVHALLAQHAGGMVPRLCALDASVPLFVDRAVAKALAKEPEQRFTSPKAFADALRTETVVAPIGRKRVAVLPPVNITNDEEQQFLILGLHESLISRLGRDDVAVLARTSVLQYQNTDKPVRDISRELSADAIVESSLFRAGDSVGIEARLIDGNSEEGLWSGSYDGKVDDIFTLYRDVSTSIADQIHGALKPKGQSTGAQDTVDPVAYEKYMRGRVHQQGFNPADLDRAMSYYEAALEIQPNYAPAYAGMSLVWGSRVVLGMVPPNEFGPRWRETAERAVELDPHLAEGHQARAQGFTWYEFDWNKAEDSYQRAIELDPHEAQTRIFYAHFLAMLHRADESDVQIERALEIDPHNPFTQMMFGIQRGLTRRYDAAIDALQSVPINPLRSYALSWLYFGLKDYVQGAREYAGYFELLGDRELAEVLRSNGSDVQAGLVRVGEVLASRAETRFVKPNKMWHAFAWGGDTDRAVEWLERGYAMRDHEVAYMGCIAIAPELAADARFQRLLTRLRLPLNPSK